MSSIQENLSMKNTPFQQKTVLVVEDDEAIAEMLVQTVSEETPHQVMHTASTTQTLDIMKNTKPDLLILNYHLPTMTGIELYDKVASKWKNTPAIVVSANLPQHEVAKRNIVGMHKPFEMDEFLDTIERLLAKESA